MPKDPDRPRQFDNAKIGFLLGLKEDHVGYKVFIPAENTRKWAPDVDFDESILYGDRNRFHDYRLEEVDSETRKSRQNMEIHLCAKMIYPRVLR